MIPSAIIFINSDISTISQETIVAQLEIDEVMELSEFNIRLQKDPNYSKVIHLNNIRILVRLIDFTDLTNRSFADLTLFVKLGLAYILKNNFGPPTATHKINNINLYTLLRDVGSSSVQILPQENCDHDKRYNIFGSEEDDCKHKLNWWRPNCDTEDHNKAFKNRK